MSSSSPRRGIEEAIHVDAGRAIDWPLEPGGEGSSPGPTRLKRWSDGAILEIPPTAASVDRPGLYRCERVEADAVGAHRYVVVHPNLELLVYTLIPRVSGPVDSWKRHLDHIQTLGFDSILLLPLTAMGASRSPYSVSDHFEIDESYCPGTPAQRLRVFDSFIEECSRRSIRVGVDLVLNHVATDGRVAREHREWLAEDQQEPDGIRRAGWSDGKRWHSWRDLAKLEFLPFDDEERERLHDYLDRYSLFWADRAAATSGIVRLDNLHSSNPAYLSRLLRLVRRTHPGLIVLGELFGDEEMIKRTTNSLSVNLLLGTPWEHKFVPELRRYLQYVHRMYSRMRFHLPVSSHDSGTIVQEFGSPLATAPRLAASVLLGTGSTGIVQGIEYGEERKIEFIGEPVTYTPAGVNDYTGLVRRLNALYHEHPVFRRAGNVLFVDSHHEAIIAAFRVDPETGRPVWLVCANFDTFRPHAFTLPASSASSVTLRDALSDRVHRWNEDPLRLTFDPGGIGAFRCDYDS